MPIARVTSRSILAARTFPTTRKFATALPVSSATRSHKVVVIGGGSAGLTISHQLLRSGRFAKNDIAVIDPATWHHYQPGWTLVSGGLKTKEELRRPLDSLIDQKIKFYDSSVDTFSPQDNFLRLDDGGVVDYEQLVVAPGISIDYGSIKGLPEALANPDSLVSTTYGYHTCDKVFHSIKKLRQGVAIFTQPAGIVKCGGAPQKIMWLALDHWKRAGLYDPGNPSNSTVNISFATGISTMFAVPKYNSKLEELRQKRGVEGLFQHDLIAIDGNRAIFSRPDGEHITKQFDLLHVVPKMGPHAFVQNSGLADEAGYIDIHPSTLRHKRFPNIWSAGDASNLPTSKTAAAITAQAPVLVHNLLQSLDGNETNAVYDGYTSCPLLTEYGKVVLAEFKYGGEPQETFNTWFGIDQTVPRRVFYHLKKDFFPWVYYKYMVKGTWGGPKGWIK
ncbi:unnamed protein product [Aureobasidium mustum]|uniref:FAD/NAD(P)-binding domain-containing protein n=1 Tax=Aureobasidium mustum TaxID=2773714 RepID=A0A9N8JCF6_9PEZI|nr:unnamed protein product [Aureobasidium mustum]